MHVSPETTHENDPGVEVAVYSVITSPPLFKGAVHVRVACVACEDTVGSPGLLGSPSGVTAFEAALAANAAPAALVVLTVNVYEVPLVKPFTMQDGFDTEEVGAIHVAPPGLDVTR